MQIMQKIERSVVKIALLSIFVMSLVSAVVCFAVFTKHYQEVFSVKEFIFIIPALGIMVGTYFAGKSLQKLKDKTIFFLMSGIEVSLAIIMILSYDTRPTSDWGVIWDTANDYAAGNYSAGFLPNHYMYYYNWQIGLAYFESLIIRVFGESFTNLKILNTFIIVITDYCVFLYCKRKANKQIACFAYASAVFLLPWIMSIPQFTNHHATILLALLCFYLLDSEEMKKWFFAGIAASILNILRPYAIIIILSAFCLSVYRITCMFPHEKKAAVLQGIRFVFFILSYKMATSLFNWYFISIVGLASSEITVPHIPYFKFQKGLYGLNEPYTGLKNYGFDYNAYNANAYNELLTRVKNNPMQVLIFVANKMCRYLGLFDYQFEMTYNHDVSFYQQYPVRALYCSSWFQYTFMLILGLVGMIKYKQYHIDVYSIFFIGITFVYFFIEAFSSYRFESYPFLIYVSSYGYYALQQRQMKEISSA